VHSPVSDPQPAGSPVFLFGGAWNSAGWNPLGHKTVGQLLIDQVRTPNYIRSGSVPASVNLGPGVGSGDYDSLYTEIELQWGEGGYKWGFRKKDGFDLAIDENGYPPQADNHGFLRGGSDVFLVSLGYRVGEDVMWTGYRYTKPHNYEPEARWQDNNGNPHDGNFGETPSWGVGPTYLTLIDALDFGLGIDTWIVGVRIRNAVWFRDWVTSPSGEGWVVLNQPYSGTGDTYPFRDSFGSVIDY